MKKIKVLTAAVLIALMLIGGAGCSKEEVVEEPYIFSPSDGILETGYWDGVTAKDHVTLCQYLGIPVPKDVSDVSDAAIWAEIDGILNRFASDTEITDRAVVDGDTVDIDYVGTIDGVEFQGGNTEGRGAVVTIGVTRYIDGFLEQLVGHSPGESFGIEVTFPEDYGEEDLNGKDAIFHITLNHIVETSIPVLTDAFVAEDLSLSYGWNTVSEMEEGIKKDLRNAAITDFIQGYILDNSAVSHLPEKLVEYQKNSLVFYYQGYADMYGVSLDEFLGMFMGVESVDVLFDMMADGIEEAAKISLIIQAIAEDASISVTDDDMIAYFMDQTGSDDYSGFVESYGKSYLKHVTLGETVIKRLVDGAVVGEG